MKKILLLCFLCSHYAFGQQLKFETTYYDAVDQWVAFDKKDTDSAYLLGFIYIDEKAGFTFNYEGSFTVAESGLRKIPEKFNYSLKSRLTPQAADVYLLTNEDIRQLGLPVGPEWLKAYKSNENTLDYLVRIGGLYNHVGAYAKAKELLLKAYAKDPYFEGLAFELAYNYNATKDHTRAVEVLKKALEQETGNFWLWRELGFAYKNMGNLLQAETSYRKGIVLSDDLSQKGEMAINMAQSYYEIRDRPKFEEWAAITRQYVEKGSRFDRFLVSFEQGWDLK